MIIEMNGVVKRYKELVALDHFDLQVQEGQIYGLLGPNGSGKSTAINCMLALLTIQKGDIRVFGKPITPTSYGIKRDIGLVPQEVAVVEELSVQENIDYFCGLYVSEDRQRRQLVDEAIEFCGLEKFRKFAPKKLSGGLKRRLNIACGIAHQPRLLILDEPTVAVDPQSRNSILEGIRRLNEKGKAILTGTKDELKASVNLGDQVSLRLINHTQEDIDAIRALPFIGRTEIREDHLVLDMTRGDSKVASLINFLEQRDVAIGEMTLRQPSLNDVFLEVTGKKLRDNV